jgi:hypothetical protein
MADDNLGEFGMRDDTMESALEGGKASGGNKSKSTGRGSNLTKADRVKGGKNSGGRRSSR